MRAIAFKGASIALAALLVSCGQHIELLGPSAQETGTGGTPLTGSSTSSGAGGTSSGTGGTTGSGGGGAAGSGASSTTTSTCQLGAPGDCDWALRFGATENDFAHDLALSPTGDIVLAGGFQGTMDVGPFSLSSAGDKDFFLAALSTSGDVAWARSFGSAGYDYDVEIAVDSSGDILLAAWAYEAVDLGGGPVGGPKGTFLARLDPTGQHLWSTTTTGLCGAAKLALFPNDDILLVGEVCDGALDLGAGPIDVPGPIPLFVARLDPAGIPLWVEGFPLIDFGQRTIWDVAIGADGRVALGGQMAGTTDFGGGVIGGMQQHAFLVVLDQDGKYVFQRDFGGGESGQYVNAVAFDPAGNLLAGGGLQPSADFGFGEVQSPDSAGDGWVLKLDPAGSTLWVDVATGQSFQSVRDVAPRADGGVLAVGDFHKELSLGSFQLGGFGGPQYHDFVVSLDAAGTPLWGRHYGAADGYQGVHSVLATDCDAPLIAGTFGTTIELCEPLATAGKYDVFLARIAP